MSDQKKINDGNTNAAPVKKQPLPEIDEKTICETDLEGIAGGAHCAITCAATTDTRPQ